jgi:hypothetical protein
MFALKGEPTIGSALAELMLFVVVELSYSPCFGGCQIVHGVSWEQ